MSNDWAPYGAAAGAVTGRWGSGTREARSRVQTSVA